MSRVAPAHLVGERAWERHLGARVRGTSLLAALTAGSLSTNFSEVARTVGDRPALTIEGRTASHGDLDRAAGTVGGWLRAQGVEPGDRVLVGGPTSMALVEAYLGVLRAGGTTVMVEAGAKRAELRAMIADAQPAIALVSSEIAEEIGPMLSDLGLGMAHELGELSTAARGAEAIEPAGASEHALLAYTSGTTGEPKGVPLSHANVLSSIRAAMLAWRWSPDDVLVHALPLSHQHGLSGVHAALLSGSHTLVEPRFDPEALAARISELEATVLFAVPAMYQRLDAWEGIGDAGLSSLRLAVSGSAPLPRELAVRVSEWLGQAPLERYGSTEAGLVLSNPYEGDRTPGFVGYPLPGIEVRVGYQDGGDWEAGESGELLVRGPQVFSGYWRRTQASDEVFTEDGWYRSGDLVSVAPESGAIRVTGRLKEMIISGGLNVFPREVEDALDSHPFVARSAVAGAPSERWGEMVVAFVMPEEGAAVEPAEIKGFCKERLASFKCPKRVVVVQELPALGVGKVDRKRLSEMAAAEAAIAESKEE